MEPSSDLSFLKERSPDSLLFLIVERRVGDVISIVPFDIRSKRSIIETRTDVTGLL